MTALERLLLGILLVLAALAGGWYELQDYGKEHYDAGYSAAIAAGKEARDAAATANHAIEEGLRARLLDRDTEALRKEQEYASNLADAQRRVRAGDDRLRCPASRAVQPAAAPGDRPAAAEPAADGAGPDLMPEVAEALLGDAADVARLVRRYDQVIERFNECRAVNAK